MPRPKNWEELSDEARDAWRAKRREYDRKWRETNPEKILEKQRKYSEVNREKELKRKRNYREANPDKVAEYHRKWQKANREKFAGYHRKHYAKRRTQADADRFFQLMGAAEELTKIIKQRKDEQTEEMGNDE